MVMTTTATTMIMTTVKKKMMTMFRVVEPQKKRKKGDLGAREVIVVGAHSLCTTEELNTLFACIIPYNSEFFDAIGRGDTCDRSLITSQICVSFGKIVECVNSKDVSNTECRPSAVSQINSGMEIPCKIEDFVAVCNNAPVINTGNTDTAAPDKGDGGNGAWSSMRPGWAAGVIVAMISAVVLLAVPTP
nr:hypothetical protein BaRGS_000067 [Batillaria attramentaria]